MSYAELIEEARGWLEDCCVVAEPEDLDSAQVLARIEQYYEGGWAEFVRGQS